MMIGALPFVHVRRYFSLKELLFRPLFFGMLSCKGDHVAYRPFLHERSYMTFSYSVRWGYMSR